MHISQISDLDVSGKRVFVRADLDVPLSWNEGDQHFMVADDSRLKSLVPTLELLIKNGAKHVIIAGHLGRQENEESISAEILLETLGKLTNLPVSWWPDLLEENSPGFNLDINVNGQVHLIENLRKYQGEEANDPEFAKKLAGLADLYVNEAFATSHREHASIVGVPKLLPHAAGLRFAREVETLSDILDNPKRPVVGIVSGIKEDKLKYARELTKICDLVLIGGRLPDYIELNPEYQDMQGNPKLFVARLVPDKEDITVNSIERFEGEIGRAGTVLLAGVPGKYEDEGHRQGTKRVFEAIAISSALKIASGGDTEAALTLLGLTDKFDWISVGGGAMLEFLTKGTLPGIEALKA